MMMFQRRRTSARCRYRRCRRQTSIRWPRTRTTAMALQHPLLLLLLLSCGSAAAAALAAAPPHPLVQLLQPCRRYAPPPPVSAVAPASHAPCFTYHPPPVLLPEPSLVLRLHADRYGTLFHNTFTRNLARPLFIEYN